MAEQALARLEAELAAVRSTLCRLWQDQIAPDLPTDDLCARVEAVAASHQALAAQVTSAHPRLGAVAVLLGGQVAEGGSLPLDRLVDTLESAATACWERIASMEADCANQLALIESLERRLAASPAAVAMEEDILVGAVKAEAKQPPLRHSRSTAALTKGMLVDHDRLSSTLDLIASEICDGLAAAGAEVPFQVDKFVTPDSKLTAVEALVGLLLDELHLVALPSASGGRGDSRSHGSGPTPMSIGTAQTKGSPLSSPVGGVGDEAGDISDRGWSSPPRDGTAGETGSLGSVDHIVAASASARDGHMAGVVAGVVVRLAALVGESRAELSKHMADASDYGPFFEIRGLTV